MWGTAKVVDGYSAIASACRHIAALLLFELHLWHGVVMQLLLMFLGSRKELHTATTALAALMMMMMMKTLFLEQKP